MTVHVDPIAYSVPDAAKALSIGKTKMWELIAAGEIETFKIGARTLVDADHLKAFAKSHQKPPKAA